MNFKRDFNKYHSTTDNKTYKLLRLADECLCCMSCINRGRRDWYYRKDNESKRQSSYPSWKLVSKNKKQWQYKPLTFTIDGNTTRKGWGETAEITW